MARTKIEKNISYDDEKHIYYVNMDYGKNESGKRVKATKTFKSKAEARKALREFEADKTKGTLVIPTSETLSMWLDYWIENIKARNCEETTLYGYRNIINNHINPAIGDIPLQKLTAKDINKYFTVLEVDKSLSINTIRKHYDLLKDSLQKAEDEERISKSPVNRIEPPKPILKEKNFYSPEQLQQLFTIVEGDRMEVVVKLAGYLGLRREEIAGLRWCNVNLANSKLSIVEARTQAGKSVIEKGTKNASSHRTFTLPEELKEVLGQVKAKQEDYKEQLDTAYIDSGYVMTWEDGRPYRPNYLSELFKQIIDRNQLPPLRLHDLRHTFASIANSIGVSMFDIGKALGHSNVGTTGRIYTHLFDKTQGATINNVAKAITSKE
jgi:integrase